MRVVARIPLRSRADVLGALEAHVRASVRDLDMRVAEGRPLPPLYRAGVRYDRRDPNERWQLPTETAARRRGDCEDLAAWRAAELRRSGIPARVTVRRSAPGVLHAVVDRGDGAIEDPSRRLGMR